MCVCIYMYIYIWAKRTRSLGLGSTAPEAYNAIGCERGIRIRHTYKAQV